MNCPEVQSNLSLFLYGDLDFAAEEELENHLVDCPACQLALDREKAWHATLNAEHADVPLDLLAQCRRDLVSAIRIPGSPKYVEPFWKRLADLFGITVNRWSERFAIASLCLFLGFALSHWTNRFGIGQPLAVSGEINQAGLLSQIQVRDVRAVGGDKVRLSLDQIEPGELVGSVRDEQVRRLLLSAIRNSADAGLRVDSMQLLTGQNGPDIRDVLLDTASHDPNPAVRLKALEALRPFRSDDATRTTLISVLQFDDDSGVRSQAMEVLAPSGADLRLPPDLAGAFEQIIRSERNDDYIRLRCLQILQASGPSRIY